MNTRGARLKICDHIRAPQSDWKGAYLSAKKIGKGLHKVFQDVVNKLIHSLPTFGESGS